MKQEIVVVGCVIEKLFCDKQEAENKRDVVLKLSSLYLHIL